MSAPAPTLPPLSMPVAQPPARAGRNRPAAWACTPWAARPKQHRLATVLLMLGRPFWEAAALHAGVPLPKIDEALVGRLRQAGANRALPTLAAPRGARRTRAPGLPDALRESLSRPAPGLRHLGAQGELPACWPCWMASTCPPPTAATPSRTPMPTPRAATSTASTPRACPPSRPGRQASRPPKTSSPSTANCTASAGKTGRVAVVGGDHAPLRPAGSAGAVAAGRGAGVG
jgi:hypothetical protein